MPEGAHEAAEDDLELLPKAIAGTLETRLSERDCRGEGGSEFERRSGFRVAFFTISLDDACFLIGGLSASLKALRVAFITSVASMDRCLGLRCSGCKFSWSVFALDFAGAREVAREAARALGLVVDLARDRVSAGIFVTATSDFGSKRSLRMDAVAGEHVEGERTALRTESAVACTEVIIIIEIC